MAWQKMMTVMNYLCSIVLILSTCDLFAQFSTSSSFPAQYKKQNRNALNQLMQGEIDTAILYFHRYLDSFPDDLESHYGLSMAYTQRGFFYKALKYAKTAVKLGMPMGRFVAGPRSMFSPLTSRSSFQSYFRRHGRPLIHGPMQVNFTDASASFWIRTDKPRSVQLVVDEGFAISAETTADRDYTIIITADGLQPDRDYHYEIRMDDLALHRGTFRTLPAAGQEATFSIGFGGGAGYTPQYERMWDTINTHALTAFIQMGDNVYHDMPEQTAIQQYCYYRRQSRPEYRRLVSSTPIYAIWDDHDFGDNDCYGGPEVDKPSWKRKVWNTFQQQWGNPYYGGGESNPGCYFDFGIADVDFFMLDCRYYRTDVDDDVFPDSMLGSVQMDWLFDRLRNSSATFKVIGTSVPISTGTKKGSSGRDTWDGFPEEREAIFGFIEKHQIEGVIFIAADRHRSDIWKTDRQNGYPFYEFMSSRLTNIHTHPVQQESIFGYSKKPSFGILDFDTECINPTVTYKIFSIDNEEIYSYTVYRSELSKQ